MSIVAVIRLLLSLADSVMGFARERQLLNAGEERAIADQLAKTQAKLLAAIDARGAVDPGGVSGDPNNRDKPGSGV